MGTDRSRITGTALQAATAMAALAGGVLSLGFTNPGFWVAILAVGVGTLVGTGLALLLTVVPGDRRPGGLGAWPQPDRGSGRTAPDPIPPDRDDPEVGHPARRPVGDPRPIGARPAVTAPRVVIPLPVDEPQPAAEWWTRTTQDSGGRSPVSAVPPPVRLRPLAEYSTAAALIAQCPQCGGFALNVAGSGSGFQLDCRTCANTWSWTPGTPWPTVTVCPEQPRPGRSGHPVPPRDDRAGPS